MSQRNCALEWPEGGPPPKPTHPPIERFKNGAKKTLILLGDPVKRGIHWNAEQKCSVPCFRPAHCPFCVEPKFINTAREEGFAPALLLNERAKEWQQVVAVFTKGGLNELAAAKPDDYRGCMIEVQKASRPGAVSPMQIKLLPPLPPTFPALPNAFSVKAVMMRVWFPTLDHAEPIEWIEPIKVERRTRPAENTVQAMELDPEEAVILSAKLHAHGLGNLANHVKQRPTSAAPSHVTSQPAAEPAAPPPTSNRAPQPAPAPRPRVLNGQHPPPQEQPPDEPGELTSVVDGLVNRLAPALRLSDAPLTVEGDPDRQMFGRAVQRGPKVAVYRPVSPEDEDAALTKRVGEVVCGEVKAKLNGGRKAKGGAQ